MITKQELIARLKDDIRVEEAAIGLYTRPLKDTLQVSGLSDDQRTRLASLLDRLAEDSKTHERVFTELLERVSGSDRDVY
ncbi:MULTISPECIES: hypothetical protein [Prosthecochloris]|uniref:Uncharacterized protein n=1 Tax=Prosthecochloris vibrioformis TaxID=1098 RepID=A0A5C4S065_PROVB|nr:MULTISPECIES: hypothetical protein [Prosthecochloris]ANT65018.1 hypothetical protein Ptc2401_01245 [Prosthecochloris sp. CIB 2401]TNJ36913.1 hypothetical protein FGF68_04895 [Prosthecochloris vibrioformis]